MLTNRACHLIVLLASVLLTFGCSKAGTGPAAAPSGTNQADHSGHDHDDASEITRAMASLSDEDRQAALQQELCPVSDEPLGSMGAPMKVAVQGRDVFICCEGCKDTLLGEPDKFLTKLPN